MTEEEKPPQKRRRLTFQEYQEKFPWRKGVREGNRAYPIKGKTSSAIENGRRMGNNHGAEAGRKSRRVAVPNGYTKEEAKAIRDKAAREAKIIVERMVTLGMVDETKAANEALGYAVEVVRADIDSTETKLKAARLVLDFTRSKPVQEQKVTINAAEKFLADLLDSEKPQE